MKTVTYRDIYPCRGWRHGDVNGGGRRPERPNPVNLLAVTAWQLRQEKARAQYHGDTAAGRKWLANRAVAVR